MCNGGQSSAEYRSQFSTWAILTSPLILGNDPRSMDADCLAIVLNAEVIAIKCVRGARAQRREAGWGLLCRLDRSCSRCPAPAAKTS